MKNAVLLNTLFAEYVEEVSERTMHIDDIKAIERVQKLLAYELPYTSALDRKENGNGNN